MINYNFLVVFSPEIPFEQQIPCMQVYPFPQVLLPTLQLTNCPFADTSGELLPHSAKNRIFFKTIGSSHDSR